MSRKFLIIVSSAFALCSLVVGGLYLLANRPPPTIYITDVSPGDTVHLPEAPATPALPPPLAPSVRVRLAIGSLGFADSDMDGQVSDLTLSELSGAPGLDIVERQSMNKVLGELGLNLSGLVRANDAIRAGKLLKADWFLLGTQARIAGTNSIVVRLVDARTGILREAGVIAVGNFPRQLAQDVAGFIRQARQAAVSPKPRVYLAIGAFEDLSANNRLADFSPQLNGYLISAYAGDGRVTLLEREYADTLFEELELDLAGLTDDNSAKPQPMQSAFWLADGCYQSYETGDREIEVTLEVHRMFGTGQKVLLHGASGEPVDHQIKSAIDSVLGQNAGAVFPTRLSEAHAQINKGREMAPPGLKEDPGFYQETDPRLRRNLEEAIRAFKTVLLLDPTNREAKLLLAGCLRKQDLDNMDRARNYYREVLEEPVQDGWTRDARNLLLLSFSWTSAGETAHWYESAASQTTSTAAREFYDRQAKAARAEATIVSGGSNAQELAEQRLFSSLTNVFLGNMYGPIGTREFLESYGTNQAAAARRIAELYPTFSARAPDLAPYFLAAAVAAQVDTNAPMIAEFKQMLDHYAEHPEAVFQPENFWWRVSEDFCQWGFDRKMYGMTAEFMEGKLRAGVLFPHQIWGITHEDKMCLAFADLRLERWQKALDIFQTFSNQPVKMAGSGPWGNAFCVVLTGNEASYCREKLGLPAVTNPLQFDMGKPLMCLCTPSTFTADQDGLWVGIDGQLRRLDFELRTNQVVQLPMDPSVTITALCSGPSSIWIGTAGAGLIEFDKASGKCHRFTVQDGLMMDSMSCLALASDVLWIGYGPDSAGGGGLGRLDLPSEKFTSFIPTIANGTQTHRVFGGNGVTEWTGEPTRRTVASVAAGPDGEVWFANEFDVLRHYQSKENTWEGIPQIGGCTSLAVGANRLLVGQSWNLQDDKPGPVGASALGFRDRRWQSFPEVPGLPKGAATTVTPDGDDLWVGGMGYIALLNLTDNKMRHFAYVQTSEVNRIQVGGDYVWAQFDGHLYRAPLGSLK